MGALCPSVPHSDVFDMLAFWGYLAVITGKKFFCDRQNMPHRTYKKEKDSIAKTEETRDGGEETQLGLRSPLLALDATS